MDKREGLTDADYRAIALSDQALRSLRRTATWAKVAGLCMAALALVACLTGALEWWHLKTMMRIQQEASHTFGQYSNPGLSGQATPVQSGQTPIVLLVFIGATAYGIFSWLALKFSRRLSVSDQVHRGGSIDKAIDAQRVFWKTQGIIVLCSIALGLALVAELAAYYLPAQP